MTIDIASTFITSPGSTTSQDVTIAGFGTPVMALFDAVIANPKDTISAGRASSHGGWITAGDIMSTGTWARDNVVTSATGRGRITSRGLRLFNPVNGSVEWAIDVTGVITDGIQITWVSHGATPIDLMVTLIGGAGVQGHIGHNVWSSSVVTTPMEPHALMHHGVDINSNSSSFIVNLLGMACKTGANHVTRGEVVDDGASGGVSSLWSDNRYHMVYPDGSSEISTAHEITAWGATSYTIDNAIGSGRRYMIHSVGSDDENDFDMVEWACPATTGSQSIPTPFPVQLARVLGGTETAFNTNPGSARSQGMVSVISSSFVGAMSWSSDNGPTQTVEKTIVGDHAILALNEAGAVAVRASLTSITDTDITLNYDVVTPGAVFKALLFRGPSLGPSTQPYYQGGNPMNTQPRGLRIDT